MPIKQCTINNIPGYKWGDNGKCYTGENAKEKAMAQAIAIGDFANEKISFDYDETLTKKSIQDKAIEYINKGATVYIISARHNASNMYSIADKLGIPHSRVYATGSNKAKIEKILELGIDFHYDNNNDVVKQLGSVGRLVQLTLHERYAAIMKFINNDNTRTK